MRIDINRIDDVTPEMRLNDILFEEMWDEFENRVIDYYCNDYDYERDNELIYDFEVLSEMYRILMIIKNHDIPFKAAIGLFFLDSRLKTLNTICEDYLADEKSDPELFASIIEAGYRFYDEIRIPGMTEMETFEAIESYREFREEMLKKYDE